MGVCYLPIFSPPVDYNQTMGLWENIYLNYTLLQFDVLAIDNGTIPRGVTASVNVTVSNTCVMDVLFGDIEYKFYVNVTTGGMTLRIPKYYVVEFCKYRVYLLITYTVC